MNDIGSNAMRPDEGNAKLGKKAKEMLVDKMGTIRVKIWLLISSFFVIINNILPMDKRAKKAAFEKRIRQNWVAPQFRQISPPWNPYQDRYINGRPPFYSEVRPQANFGGNSPPPPTDQRNSEAPVTEDEPPYTFELLDVEGEDQRTCSICIDDFVLGDIVYRLSCRHQFHVDCLQMWLFYQKTCPNCRQFSA